jgi:hypothetical protein
MNLKPRTEQLFGQKEFLRNSVGMEFKTAGATLDGTAFNAVAENGYVKAGTAVYKGAGDFFVPVATDTAEADLVAASLTAHDVKLVSGSNAIVGTLVAGHPLEDKCTGVTDAFKAATKGRLVFDV